MSNVLPGSVCRISDLPERPYTVKVRPKSSWKTGDYVVASVDSRPVHDARLEAPSGRTVEPLEGERIIGALGRRHATRGIVGDWREVDDKLGRMHVLGGGGIFGRATSRSPYVPRPISIRYEGHVLRNGSPCRMEDYVKDLKPETLDRPVVLVLGTSMSSGKTMSARVIVRTLVEEGFDTIACKMTGSGRYHDILSMRDAGARPVFDFVDAGLPTTVVPIRRYNRARDWMIARMNQAPGDIILVEIGASLLEPYNGKQALEVLRDQVAFTVLTASDPYAVLGFRESVDVEIDLVSGIATNTEAGIELIEQLSGFPALNLQREESRDTLVPLLRHALDPDSPNHPRPSS